MRNLFLQSTFYSKAVGLELVWWGRYTQEHKYLKQVSGTYCYLDTIFSDIFDLLCCCFNAGYTPINSYQDPVVGCDLSTEKHFYRILFVWPNVMFTTQVISQKSNVGYFRFLKILRFQMCFKCLMRNLLNSRKLAR